MVHTIISSVENYSLLLEPFTKQPYAGLLVFHLLFEEFSSDVEILKKALKNLTPADFKKRIYLLPRSQTDLHLDEIFE